MPYICRNSFISSMKWTWDAHGEDASEETTLADEWNGKDH